MPRGGRAWPGGCNADLFGEAWRPVFLVNVPLGVLVLALVPRLVPPDAPKGARARGAGRLDVGGLLIATAAVCLVVLPLALGRDVGWPAWTFACIAAGAVLAVLFVRYERRTVQPLLNLAVLRAPGLGAGLATITCAAMAYAGFLFFFTLHLEAGLGESALHAGLTYPPMTVAFGLVGFLWRRRTGERCSGPAWCSTARAWAWR